MYIYIYICIYICTYIYIYIYTIIYQYIFYSATVNRSLVGLCLVPRSLLGTEVPPPPISTPTTTCLHRDLRNILKAQITRNKWIYHIYIDIYDTGQKK